MKGRPLKLYLNKPSPYARLALVVAHEKNLAGRLDLEWTDPWQNPMALAGVNPFSRVPALVTDEGIALVDSGCICDYFDRLGSGRALIPAELQARIDTLRKYGLARTLIDATFGAVIQRRFGPGGTEPVLAARWIAAAGAALDAMEQDQSTGQSASAPDLGDLALAVGLGYIDFRLKEMAWQRNRPKLAGWLKSMQARPSMQATSHE
jgi:glutathione S-transferase